MSVQPCLQNDVSCLYLQRRKNQTATHQLFKSQIHDYGCPFPNVRQHPVVIKLNLAFDFLACTLVAAGDLHMPLSFKKRGEVEQLTVLVEKLHACNEASRWGETETVRELCETTAILLLPGVEAVVQNAVAIPPIIQYVDTKGRKRRGRRFHSDHWLPAGGAHRRTLTACTTTCR